MRIGHEPVMGFLTCYTPTTPVVFRYHDGRLWGKRHLFFTKNTNDTMCKPSPCLTMKMKRDEATGQLRISPQKCFGECVQCMPDAHDRR